MVSPNVIQTYSHISSLKVIKTQTQKNYEGLRIQCSSSYQKKTLDPKVESLL